MTISLKNLLIISLTGILLVIGLFFVAFGQEEEQGYDIPFTEAQMNAMASYFGCGTPETCKDDFEQRPEAMHAQVIKYINEDPDGLLTEEQKEAYEDFYDKFDDINLDATDIQVILEEAEKAAGILEESDPELAEQLSLTLEDVTAVEAIIETNTQIGSITVPVETTAGIQNITFNPNDERSFISAFSSIAGNAVDLGAALEAAGQAYLNQVRATDPNKASEMEAFMNEHGQESRQRMNEFLGRPNFLGERTGEFSGGQYNVPLQNADGTFDNQFIPGMTQEARDLFEQDRLGEGEGFTGDQWGDVYEGGGLYGGMTEMMDFRQEPINSVEEFGRIYNIENPTQEMLDMYNHPSMMTGDMMNPVQGFNEWVSNPEVAGRYSDTEIADMRRMAEENQQGMQSGNWTGDTGVYQPAWGDMSGGTWSGGSGGTWTGGDSGNWSESQNWGDPSQWSSGGSGWQNYDNQYQNMDYSNYQMTPEQQGMYDQWQSSGGTMQYQPPASLLDIFLSLWQ